MRLVAAARGCVVLRSRSRLLVPSLTGWPKFYLTLQARLRFEDADLPLLRQRQVRKVGLLVITGDRGLCGAYNTNVIRRGVERAKELTSEGVEYTYILVGRKSNQYFQRREQPIEKLFIPA